MRSKVCIFLVKMSRPRQDSYSSFAGFMRRHATRSRASAFLTGFMDTIGLHPPKRYAREMCTGCAILDRENVE
jgi:hypothetical protein